MIKITSQFQEAAALPIEYKMVVADYTARDAIVSTERFDGLFTYVVATNENWQLQGGITNGNWVNLGSGSASFPIATAAGSANVITATYSPALTLTNLTICAFVATAANTTTTPTFSPNGLAAKVITKQGGQALVAGDIPGALAVCLLEYNSANNRWELLNPATAVALATTTNSIQGNGSGGSPIKLVNDQAVGSIPNGYLYGKAGNQLGYQAPINLPFIGDVMNLTYAAAATLSGAGGVKADQVYLITDRADTGVMLTGMPDGKSYSVTGWGGFLLPDYQNVNPFTDLSNIPGFITSATQRGVWYPEIEQIAITYTGATLAPFTVGEVIDNSAAPNFGTAQAKVISDDGAGNLVCYMITAGQVFSPTDVLTGQTSTNTATVASVGTPSLSNGDLFIQNGNNYQLTDITQLNGTIPGSAYTLIDRNWRTINYNTLTGGTFTVGNTVTDAVTGATGTILYDDGASKMIILWSAGTIFQPTDAISDGTASAIVVTQAIPSTGYSEEWDSIEYDFGHDMVQLRLDRRGNSFACSWDTINALGSPFSGIPQIPLFQWGHDVVTGCDVIQGSIQNINFVGVVYDVTASTYGLITSTNILASSASMYNISLGINANIAGCVFGPNSSFYNLDMLSGSFIANILLPDTGAMFDMELSSGALVSDCTIKQNASINACTLYEQASISLCVLGNFVQITLNTLFPAASIYACTAPDNSTPAACIYSNVLEAQAQIAFIIFGIGCNISYNKIGAGGGINSIPAISAFGSNSTIRYNTLAPNSFISSLEIGSDTTIQYNILGSQAQMVNLIIGNSCQVNYNFLYPASAFNGSTINNTIKYIYNVIGPTYSVPVMTIAADIFNRTYWTYQQYVDDTAAGTAGLQSGELYQTATTAPVVGVLSAGDIIIKSKV